MVLLGTSACSGGDLWQLSRLKCGPCSFLHNQPACSKTCPSSFSSAAAVLFLLVSFNLGFPPVACGSDDRIASVTTGHLWDGICVLVGDEPASCSGNERMWAWSCSLVYRHCIVSLHDEITLVLFYGCPFSNDIASSELTALLTPSRKRPWAVVSVLINPESSCGQVMSIEPCRLGSVFLVFNLDLV